MVDRGPLRFVTSNPGKVREARQIFHPLGFRVAWSRRVLPEVQADSLAEVVRSKLAPLPRDGRIYLVEDSGLFFDGLGGFPGVYSAYAYRTLGLSRMLRLLEGADRSATFRAAAGVRRGRRTWIEVGEVTGEISRKPRGTGGFGFDPIFIPRGENRTFAEMSATEKNRFSHRGRSFRAMADRLAPHR